MNAVASLATPSPEAKHWTLAVGLALAIHLSVLLSQTDWHPEVEAPAPVESATFLPQAQLPIQREVAATPAQTMVNSTLPVAAVEALVNSTAPVSAIEAVKEVSAVETSIAPAG